MTKKYECSYCHGIFKLVDDEQWNQGVAEAELRQNFGSVPLSECEIICDDCYKIIMRQ